jgi:hypothetical protein
MTARVFDYIERFYKRRHSTSLSKPRGAGWVSLSACQQNRQQGGWPNQRSSPDA